MDSAVSLLCCEEIIGSPWPDSPSFAGRTEISSCFDLPFTPLFLLDDDAFTADFLLDKELQYLPDSSYFAQLQSSQHLSTARWRSVCWLLKAHNNFNFSPLTVALAVNYFDRYLAKNLSMPWKVWMFELLSVACLSIAAKMEEVDVPALLDMQIDGMEHSFENATVQRMELTVLSGLGWKLRSVTPFAFAELALNYLDLDQYLKNSLIARVSELLLKTLPEVEFVQFQPSIIAASAIRCALQESIPVQADTLQISLFKFIPLDKEKFRNCHTLLEELVVDPLSSTLSLHGKSPLSPISVVPEVDHSEEDTSGENSERRLQDSRTCVWRIEADEVVFVSSYRTDGTKRQRRY